MKFYGKMTIETKQIQDSPEQPDALVVADCNQLTSRTFVY